MASPSLAVRILPETERGLAFNAISGSYAVAGAPTDHAAIVVRFYNGTDALLSFSWDGSNSALSLAPGVSFTLDAQANRGVSESLMLAKGTQFWIKQTTVAAPTVGFAFISVFYATTMSGS